MKDNEMKIVKTKLDTDNHYLEYDINDIKIDDITIFPIFIIKDEDYVIIIEAGTKITDSLYKKLQKQDKLYLLNKDIHKQTINQISLMDHIKYNSKNYKKIMNILYETNEKLFNDFYKNPDDKIDIDLMNTMIESILYLAKNDKQFLKSSMEFFHYNYEIHHHSLHVALYAIQLSELLNLNEKQLLQISTAALLHDIGYKSIDPSITAATTELSKTDIKTVNDHVKYSIEIAKHNKLTDPIIINAIAHHHERYDGSGYPGALIESDINEFGSILAICDTFDALTSDRPHRDKLNSYDALIFMTKDTKMKKQLNQHYLKLGISSILQ